jgi:molybdopterin molybdotransferase
MPSPLHKGMAVKVFTGAPLPRGVEAVIMKEFCVEQGAHVLVQGPVARYENIRRRGCEYARGAAVLKPGARITPPVAGLLASLGRSSVRVYIRPRVALVITGNELATPGRTLREGQVYESNSYALASALRGLGLRLISSQRVRDDKRALAVALEHALGRADVVITSGGVSVGEFDLVKEVAGKLGVRTGFWRAAIKPGMPVYFGLYRSETPTKTAARREGSGVRDKLVFGLPGNPVSALVVFHQLVQPALQHLMGQRAPQRLRLQARLATSLRHNPGRLEWVRGVLEIRESALWVVPTPSRESHMLTGLVNARVLIEFPASSTTLRQGSTVWVEWLQWG